MPAVVRGGRRQGQKSPPQTESAPRSAASRSAAAPKAKPASKGNAPRRGGKSGRHQAMGSLPMPPEMIGWVIAAMLAVLVAAVMLSGSGANAVGGFFTRIVDGRLASLGLKLTDIRLEGISAHAEKDVKAAIHLQPDQPLALLDLKKIRAEVMAVGWVRDATVRRQFPGTLIITVEEKPRLAVWQYNRRQVVIDDQGQVIKGANATLFTDLPYVMGEGAGTAATPILELLRARPALMERVAYLVRVDTRRWDIHLKGENAGVIKLPALNQDEALNRLDQHITQHRVLDQRFAVIDLRDPENLVLMRASASE